MSPTFDHPALKAWCADHGYFWSSCPGCVWRDHGDKYGMTLATVKTQEIAKALEDERDRLLGDQTAHETAHEGPNHE